MPATLSVMGMYNYDDTILDPLKDAMPDESLKSIIVDCLFSECAELEVIYPAPTVFKTILAAWCKYRKKIWLDLWNTTNLEYNPIHNYDRTETERIDRTGTYKNNLNGELSHNTSTVETGQDASTTNKDYKYGFNSTNTKVPVIESSSTPGNYHHDTYISDGSKTNTNNNSNANEYENRSLHNVGNIGVTTTQEMIQQQRDIVKYDIVDDIINDFKAKFCLMVY